VKEPLVVARAVVIAVGKWAPLNPVAIRYAAALAASQGYRGMQIPALFARRCTAAAVIPRVQYLV